MTLQGGYSSPTQFAITRDLGLSVSEVRLCCLVFSFFILHLWTTIVSDLIYETVFFIWFFKQCWCYGWGYNQRSVGWVYWAERGNTGSLILALILLAESFLLFGWLNLTFMCLISGLNDCCNSQYYRVAYYIICKS